MFMIVETGGMQFRLEPSRTVKVPLLKSEPGQHVCLNHVLAIEDDHGVTLGRPFVEGAEARTTVVGHGRGPKIRGFKFKRRKNYRRRWGHRQGYTELKVEELVVPQG
ncbi:MAG: 50S ribosomal protein L21 [Candidatus Eisenbacteria bacterium]|jgi:large subunit ribosomal protein L21|nr:50S ribosomal protein L21 [Candidatus Eisenbacteria bacterium]